MCTERQPGAMLPICEQVSQCHFSVLLYAHLFATGAPSVGRCCAPQTCQRDSSTLHLRQISFESVPMFTFRPPGRLLSSCPRASPWRSGS